MSQSFGLQSKRALNKGQILRSQSGQLVVEYILLLVIAVSVAIIITSTMVSRNEEEPGFIMMKWRQIIDTVAADTADDLNPEEE